MPLMEHLNFSSATQAFRDAVERFARTGAPNERISFATPAPAVKVERTITMILRRHPELEIERVEIDAVSGCSSFQGVACVRTSADTLRVDFDWDCRWKAVQLGWTDYFGFPDQARAAREFGFDCFRVWDISPDPRPEMGAMTG
jgi:hypothetical protein